MDGLPLQTFGANGRTPACVVDVRLSLGAGGLFWVLGLARSMPVWLVQTHWAIVEDPFYLTQEPLVRWLASEPTAPLDECRATIQDSCAIWRDARRDLTLETRPHVYWPAERLREASVPKRGWPDVVAFCDALAAGIDRRRQRSPEAVNALADCARDTVALAAALGALGEPVPFVLTRLTAGETEPDLPAAWTRPASRAAGSGRAWCASVRSGHGGVADRRRPGHGAARGLAPPRRESNWWRRGPCSWPSLRTRIASATRWIGTPALRATRRATGKAPPQPVRRFYAKRKGGLAEIRPTARMWARAAAAAPGRVSPSLR